MNGYMIFKAAWRRPELPQGGYVPAGWHRSITEACAQSGPLWMAVGFGPSDEAVEWRCADPFDRRAGLVTRSRVFRVYAWVRGLAGRLRHVI